jgi:putative ABC transport system permease protein
MQSPAQVFSGDQNWTTAVSGTSPEYFEIRDWPVAHGSLFTRSDVESGAKVAVLGQTVVDKLFGHHVNPVGETVRVNNVPFLVVGVLAAKGQSPVGQDYDDSVFVPQTTFRATIRGGLQNYIAGVIFVSATSPETTKEAQEQITRILRDRHHIHPDQEDDFSIRNLTELANAWQKNASILTALLAAIAAVSLLVGGIGIMNIMLVSVTERTREIGIRMAVGASPWNILSQFLVEAVTLSVAGGGIGVALGTAGARYLTQRFGWPMVVRVDIVVIAVGFSALVGIVFGLYPALKASRLDPIDALRYE